MIEFNNVSKIYPKGTKALKDVSFTIDNGEFVFIIGPSGAGKSTIFRLLLKEEDATSGNIRLNKFNYSKVKKRHIPFLRRNIGVVFQDFRLIANMTVYQNVAFAMRVIGASRADIAKRVPYVLKLVGIAGKAGRYPDELSGGEKQRLAIARALVNNPSIIIADEPTGNVDPERSMEIMYLLSEINKLGTTVVVVTHEKELVDYMNKRVISIDKGYVVSDKQGGYY